MKSEVFDKRVRASIGQRKIEPSRAAWDKLEHMLDQDERHVKRNINRLWYAAAAVAVLFMAGLSLMQQNTLPGGEKIITDKEAGQTREALEGAAVITSAQAVVNTEGQAETERAQDHRLTHENSKFPAGVETMTFRPKLNPVAVNLESKSLQYVPGVKSSVPGQVSDREIDALLANAHATLNARRSPKSSEINAAALLAGVEEELDQNFKDKALEAIKTGFVKLRTAVVERNQ